MKQKKELETKIKKQVLSFEKNSGLKINYIDVTKTKNGGFNNTEDTAVTIKILND